MTVCFVHRVEAAKEAQQKVKEALKRHVTAISVPFLKVSEPEKLTSNFTQTPSPRNSSPHNSPMYVRTVGYTRDPIEMSHTPKPTVASVVETPGISGEEVRVSPGQMLSSVEANIGGDTEMSVARDTFEGMLETLSRTKESIARATRHALECAKFGIAEQVLVIVNLCLYFACHMR